MESVLAIDTETNGLDPRHDPNFRLLGVSYANTEGLSAYRPVGHIATDANISHNLVLQELRSLLARANTICFHNAKFDLVALSRGLALELWSYNWYCTLLMQHMIDENLPSKQLDYLGKHHFNEGKAKDEKFDKFVKTFGWAFLPVWMVEEYAIQDAKLTLKLFQLLYPGFKRQGFDE